MATVLPPLPVPGSEPPRTALGRWLAHTESSHHGAHTTFPWYRVIWLTGVDYFSTLGYQPGIALMASGLLSPLATIALVLVTLFGALPVYAAVARRSYSGQGSISMLERLLPGWLGKVFVLALVGFASTGFVITMTLSAADAATHAVENPFLNPYLEGGELVLTIILLGLLAALFLKGFDEAVGLASWITLPYLALNLAVIGRGGWEIVQHPELWTGWTADLSRAGDPGTLLIGAALAFPHLALGLSGFETGVTVMPLIDGEPLTESNRPPTRRIAGTRRLLTTAAGIMSLYLVGSSLVTTMLIPESAWREGGEASGRALAWLAHRYLGDAFGTIYDASTILILWFAGASAMVALLNLIPQYLPRFGMAPTWVAQRRPLVLLILGIDIVVTWLFDANVEDQAGAYATGVLALILSAAVAATLAVFREAREAGRVPFNGIVFAAISLLFVYTLIENVAQRPDGLIISSIFIGSILLLSGLSRYLRATEFRVEKVALATDDSVDLWPEIRGKGVHLVAVKMTGAVLARKKARLKKFYAVDGPIVWIHVDLAADRSSFDSTIYLRIARLGDDYRISVTNAAAIANTIAYLSELIEPKSIFLGLTRENPVGQAVRYLLWGEGETGILVYQILLKYWNWTEEDDARPNIFLMSD
jgi:hypothetical protein